MKLYHPQKGILTKAGTKYKPLGNKMVDLYADKFGKKHELDGKEMPLDELEMRSKELQDQQMESEMQKEAELSEKEAEMEEAELEQEQKMRLEYRKVKRHTELLETIKESPKGVLEAIKGIPHPVDHIKEFKAFKDELVLAIQTETDKLDKEIDLSPVIKAIQAIKIPEVKIPEPKDYTKLLKEIKEALPENTDLSRVEKLLSQIKPFEIPEKLLRNDRLKVEVDRIALGGSGGFSSVQIEDASHTKINPASEETLQSLLAASGGANYKQRVADSGGYTYVGKAALGSATSSAVWQVKRVDSNGSIDWADADDLFDNVWDNYSSLSYS